MIWIDGTPKNQAYSDSQASWLDECFLGSSSIDVCKVQFNGSS
jgi:hypothetical protein